VGLSGRRNPKPTARCLFALPTKFSVGPLESIQHSKYSSCGAQRAKKGQTASHDEGSYIAIDLLEAAPIRVYLLFRGIIICDHEMKSMVQTS
jgi:hypothetical protein